MQDGATQPHTHSHVDNEGVQDGGQDGLLTVDVLHLSQSNHLCDGHDLESVELPCGNVSSQYHTTKRACAWEGCTQEWLECKT